MMRKSKQENHVSFKGDKNSVIWKSDVTTLQKKSKLFSRKDYDVIFLRKGAFLGAFDDREEYYIINDKASAFGPMFKREKEITECAAYYVSRVAELENKWGTPNKIDVYDKGYDMHTEVGANGSYKFAISNAMKLFSKVQGADETLTQEQVQEFFRSELNMEIRNAIATVFMKNKFGMNDIAVITTKEKQIAEQIKEILEPVFDEYGVKLTKLYIERFMYDEDFLDRISEIKKESILRNMQFSENKDLRKDQRKEAKRSGRITTENKFCTNCGHENTADANFCGKCGTKL